MARDSCSALDLVGVHQGSLEVAEERAELFTTRVLVKCALSWEDHLVQTDGNVSGTQVQTAAAYSVWQKGRVEQSSRKRRTKRFGNIKWLVSVVSCEVVYALNPRTGVGNPPASRVFGQQTEVYGELMEHGEVVFHSNVVDERYQLARRFIIQASAREVLERHVASEATRRIDIWIPRL